MTRALNFIGGFLLGAVSSAAVALLLAPQSGATLRESLRREVEAILAEGRQAAAQRQKELEAHLERLRTGEA